MQVYIYFNGYDVKGSPFMMRVGTQRRSKSSSSPNATYRQSPTSNTRSSPSPIHNSALKTPSYSPYRPSPSPTFNETQKYAQDYHHLHVEKEKLTPRTVSPNSYAPRSPSPTFAHRTQSPSFNRTQSPSFNRTQSPSFNGRTQSPDYISSKKLNDRRFLASSPKNDYESNNYTNKLSAMRLTDSRSPAFLERSSPEYNNYSTNSSRYERRVTETHSTSNNAYDREGGIDTSPIVKVSAAADRPTARRDSWDAIAKTRNLLSHRSLESVANLTEAQLNAEMNRKRDNGEYHEQNYQSQKYSSSNVDNYNSAERSYGSIQKPYKNGIKSGGAAAVKVQPVPDGVLGQPVEFESKQQFFRYHFNDFVAHYSQIHLIYKQNIYLFMCKISLLGKKLSL